MSAKMRWDFLCWLALALLAIGQLGVTNAEQTQISPNNQERDDDTSYPHVFTINRKLYEVSKIKADWYLAKIECSLKGMDLLSIETLQEQEEIVAIISEYGESFWTSGSDHARNGYFHWESTGHAIGPHYYNWGSSQPDDGALVNITDQNCMLLNHLDSYKWHDLGCTGDLLRFICEERVPQPSNSFTYGDSYYEVSVQLVDRFTANYACKSKGMVLANIQTELEYEAIRRELGNFGRDPIWIAASDLGREGDFYWDGIGDFLGPFTNWNESQPNNEDGKQHCVYMLRTTQYWDDTSCYWLFRYLCESKIEETEVGFQHGNGLGNERRSAATFAVGDSTYEVSTTKVDWYFAKVECQLKGMELLSIETQEEQEALVELINVFDEHFWTSGNDDIYPFTWDSTGHTMWPAKYINWAAGQPDNGAAFNISGENCVILNSTDAYKWYDFGCNADTLRFICEKKASREDETTSFTYADSFYEVAALSQNWWNANRDCRSRNMDILSIETAEEAEAISAELTGSFFNITSFWIAATDLGRESNFYWDTTGEFVGPYTNWYDDEPDNVDGKQHCVCFTPSEGWYDDSCLDVRRYICEKKI